MERRRHRESLQSGRVPVPLMSDDRGGIPCQDPWQFKFAIICMRCTSKFATLQEARRHFQDCPFGKPIDVLCGQCELRTSLWPAMCAHLNQSGMQKQVACKPEYRMAPPPRVEFAQEVQPFQSPASPVAMTVLGHSECAGTGEREWKAPIPLTLSHPDRQHVARAWRNSEPYYYIGEGNTQVERDYEGLGRRCPLFPWSQLRGEVIVCQPPPQEVPEIWPPPVRTHRALIHLRWKRRVLGQVRNLQDRHPWSAVCHPEWFSRRCCHQPREP